MIVPKSLVWVFLSLTAVDVAPPFTKATFDEACTAARADKKQVLLYFSDPDSPQSKAYRELTWSNEKVQRWIKTHVTAIEVTPGRGDDLRKRFAVRLLPTVLIVAPGGTVRARVVGFRDGDKLLHELESTLKAGDPVALARGRVEADAQDPAASLMYARTLADAGRIDDALKQYRRCFELGLASSSGYGGIRLVVIEELGRLAAEHEAARQFLAEQRDASRARILEGHARRGDPAVLAAANARLDALDDTLSVLHQLKSQRPDSLAFRLLRECAVDSALKIKDYQQIPALIDIVEHADRACAQFEEDRKRPLPPDTDESRFRTFERHAFVERTVRYYEMLIGTGRLAAAAGLASKLLAVDDSAFTYGALARAGLRTGHPVKDNLRQARKAVELSKPPDGRALSVLVEILMRLDRSEEAARVVATMGPQLSDPNDRTALQRLLHRKADD